MNEPAEQQVPDTVTWSVVATVKSPEALLKSFVAHHLSLGAAEVFLYFDDADDPLMPVMLETKRVHVTACNAEHWSAEGGRPEILMRRQMLNANDALTKSNSEWIAHLDCDEFLHPEQDIGEFLAQTAATHIQVLPMENYFLEMPKSIGDVLRSPIRSRVPPAEKQLLRQIYGKDYVYASHGLLEHTQGKAFVRRNSRLRLTIHYPRGENKITAIAPFQLLHIPFFGARDWLAKNARKWTRVAHRLTPSHTRFQQYTHIMNIATEGRLAILDAFERIFVLRRSSVERLADAGFLRPNTLELAGKVRDVFGPGDHGFGEPLKPLTDEDVAIAAGDYANQALRSDPPGLQPVRHPKRRLKGRVARRNLQRLKRAVTIDFFCIGAQKAGTTWLYEQIKDHESIFIPKKEPHYLTRLNTVEHTVSVLSRRLPGQIIGDMSVNYSAWPTMAKRVYAAFPAAKILFIVRDPVQRAFSQYNMDVKAGRIETGTPFIETFRKDLYQIQRRGRYEEILREYDALFPLGQSLKVFDYDDISVKPEWFVDDVLRFLGVSSGFRSDRLKERVWATEKKVLLQAADAEEVHRYYADQNDALGKFLGRRFDWM